MKFFLLLLAAGLGLTSLTAARAQSAPPNDQEGGRLVITNGTFVRGGQKVPATVRNLVDLIEQRYRKLMINVVGAEDVVIDNVTLRWPATNILSEQDRRDGAMRNLLLTLSEASGRKFRVEASGPDDYLLAGEPREPQHTQRMVEMFNLTTFLRRRDRTELEIALNEAERHLQDLKTKFTDQYPEVVEARKTVEARRRQILSDRQPLDAQRLVGEIQTVTRDTLVSLNFAGPVPEFKFHPGTNLLIVVGSEPAIAVTRKVVAALTEGR